MLPKSVQKIIAKQETEESENHISQEETKALLRKQGCSEAYIEKVFTPPENKLEYLGVAEGCAFYEFYTNIGFIPMGQGDELHSLDEIINEKESQFHEDEYPGIYDRFLQISSIEGEGSYFYDIELGLVYDANWGEENSMIEGTLEKKWPGFYEFLEWYYSDTDDYA